MKNKKYYIRSQSAAIIAILLGILLMINPDFGTESVGLIVGIVFAAIGVLILAVSFISFPVLGIMECLVGITALLIGIVLIRTPNLLGKLLGYVISGMLLIRGVQDLGEARQLKRNGYSAKFSFVLSIIMIVVGVILFFVPLASSRILMRLVGIIIVTLGVINVGNEANYVRKIAKEKKDIIDADE